MSYVNRFKFILCLVGLITVAGAQAQASKDEYYGWSRITNAAWSEQASPDTGQCVDVPGGSTVDQTMLIMYPCNSGSNQFFRLKDNNFDSTRIAVYSGGNEKCLDINNFGGIVIVSCEHAITWKIAADNTIHPDPDHWTDSPCMSVQPDGELVYMGCDDVHSKLGSNWRLPVHLDSPAALKSGWNPDECLDVRGGWSNPGTPLLHYRCNGGPNQQFQLRGEMSNALITVYNEDKLLCVVGVHDSTVNAVPCNATDTRQLWQFTLLTTIEGQKTYTVQHRPSKRCLDASRSSADTVLWNCHGGYNQRWITSP